VITGAATAGTGTSNVLVTANVPAGLVGTVEAGASGAAASEGPHAASMRPQHQAAEAAETIETNE
jgi:hypothetical protein